MIITMQNVPTSEQIMNNQANQLRLQNEGIGGRQLIPRNIMNPKSDNTGVTSFDSARLHDRLISAEPLRVQADSRTSNSLTTYGYLPDWWLATSRSVWLHLLFEKRTRRIHAEIEICSGSIDNVAAVYTQEAGHNLMHNKACSY
jgi:hypothetical protein